MFGFFKKRKQETFALNIPDGTYSFRSPDGKFVMENCTFTNCRLIDQEQQSNKSGGSDASNS